MNSNPKYAVVRLRPDDDVFQLFRLLVQHGYPEVSFINDVRDDWLLPTGLAASGLIPSDSNSIKNDSSPPGDSDSDATSSAQDIIRNPLPPPLSRGIDAASLIPEAVESAFRESNPTPPYSLNTIPITDVILSKQLIPVSPDPLITPVSLGRPNNRKEPPMPTLTNPATTQLRQRGSRAQSDDPSVYATCNLCQNRIMASRLSNLTNHVRRHAILKQFQCCYCEYTHNEMAKVRLHMLHNHKDKDSQPIDNLSPEMQAQWDILMDQCFPDYNRDTFTNREKSPITMVPIVQTAIDEQPLEDLVSPSPIHTCIECGEMMSTNNLVHHMEQYHSHNAEEQDGTFVCSACNYEATDEWKVRLHISLKHDEQSGAKVLNEVKDDQWLAEPIKIEPSEPNEMGNDQLFRQLSEFSFVRPDTNNSIARQGLANLRCELCHKLMPGSRPLSSLLSHAKRHYHLKQFQCTECAYCSSEAAHVRSHMKLRHKMFAKTPVDNKTPSLQSAWMQIMARCFPTVAPKLGKFRFKNFRSKQLSSVVDIVDDSPSPAKQPSQCRLCGDTVSADHQSEHAAAHIPVKPFGCSVCQFRASEYQQLRAHLLKHKLTGDEKHNKAKMATDNGALKAQYLKFCFAEEESLEEK